MVGTFISLSGTNWLVIWVGMEINMLSFIPIMVTASSNQEAEASIKYFISQAWASAIFLLGSLAQITLTAPIAISSLLILFSLLIKAGIPPYHSWYPQVMRASSWVICIILSSWQKLTPLLILFWAPFHNKAVVSLALVGVLVGGVGGLVQTQLRPIIAYSSITHVRWMCILSPISSTTSTIYLAGYITLMLPVILAINSLTATKVSATSISTMSPIRIVITFLLLVSLAGLPPTSGFTLKLIALSVLLHQNIVIVSLLLLISTLITLTFYLNLMFFSLLSASKSSLSHYPTLSSLIPISLASVWLTPLLYLS